MPLRCCYYEGNTYDFCEPVNILYKTRKLKFFCRLAMNAFIQANITEFALEKGKARKRSWTNQNASMIDELSRLQYSKIEMIIFM